MPVDLNQIDENFPVAGEDNDSQGFRTNFTTIKEALDELQTLGPGYVGSRGIQGYAGSRGFVGSEGAQGPQGYTGSIGIGYTGSAGTGGGGSGPQGPQGPAGSPGGYTGSVGDVGFTGSAGTGGGGSGPQGPQGYVGSIGPQGPAGYVGSVIVGGSGGATWIPITGTLTAAVNSRYVLNPTAPTTINLPVGSDGDTIQVRMTNTDINNATFIDVANSNTLSTITAYSADVICVYQGPPANSWYLMRNGNMYQTLPAINYYPYDAVIVNNNAYGDEVISRAMTIDSAGRTLIPIPSDIGGAAALTVNAFPGYVGSNTATGNAAIESIGAAHTPVIDIGNSGTAFAINCELSNVFTLALTGSVSGSGWTIRNPNDGQTINLFITQGSGPYTLGWPSSFRFPGGSSTAVISSTNGKVDLLVMTYRSGTGLWYCTLLKDFSA